MLAIIDGLIALDATLTARISEKTGRMLRKPKPENVVLGKVLAQYRVRHGETQQELADAIGKERVTVGAYEKGMAGMPFQVREAVAQRYGIPHERLGLDLPKAGELPTGQEDAARALALYVLKTTEDPEARRLASEFLAASLAIKI